MSNKVNLTVPIDLMLAEQNPDQSPKQRTFKGIANTGKPFSYGGIANIIDFSTLKLSNEPTPVLISHDREKYAGVATFAVTANGLEVEGKLFDNEHGKNIADLADQGAVWQLSVRLQSETVHELGENEVATINHQTVKGRMLVIKNGVIREVSFTPIAVDGETTVVVLEDPKPDDKEPPKKGKSDKPPSNDAEAKIAELEAQIQKLTEDNEALRSEIKKTKVDQKLSEKGFTREGENWKGLSNETYQVLLSLDDDKTDRLIADLNVQKNESDSWLLGVSNPSQNQFGEVNPLLEDAKNRGGKK